MIYSIGTSNRTVDEFMVPLLRHNVCCVIDVRSRPYSRLGWFCKAQLASHLYANCIDYIWLGNLLGGHVNPTTDMNTIQKGLATILSHAENGSIAYFCAEGDPAQCHRVLLVGRFLLELHGVVTENILRDDSIEDVDETLCRVFSRTTGSGFPGGAGK